MRLYCFTGTKYFDIKNIYSCNIFTLDHSTGEFSILKGQVVLINFLLSFDGDFGLYRCTY